MGASINKDDQKKIESLQEKNRRLQKKVDALSDQVAMQSKILNVGNISTVEMVMEQLTAYINAHLKKIQAELLYSEYDAHDTLVLFRFREFLLSIYTQLGSFMVLTDGLVHIEMRRLQDKHCEIGNVLDRLNGMPSELMLEILDEQDRLYEHILQIIEEAEETEETEEKPS